MSLENKGMYIQSILIFAHKKNNRSKSKTLISVSMCNFKTKCLCPCAISKQEISVSLRHLKTRQILQCVLTACNFYKSTKIQNSK